MKRAKQQPRLALADQPRDMFAEYRAAGGHMSEGWMNTCPDGCGQFIWFAARPGQPAKRCELDGETRHECGGKP